MGGYLKFVSFLADGFKESSIKVGDRIVYFGDEPCRGTVRWLGKIEDICSGVTAGIELDEPNGTNSGCWAERQIFECRKHHGVFINLAGLIKENDFGVAEAVDRHDEEIRERVGRTKIADSQQDVEDDQQFARLKQAIVDGQPDEAAALASRMARMFSTKPATCGKTKNTSGAELHLKVQVEKKDGDTEIQVSIPDNFTIKMLAEKVDREFGYEFNRQRWFFLEEMVMDYSESVKKQKSLTPVLYIKEVGAPLDAPSAANEMVASKKKTTDATAETKTRNKVVEVKPDPSAGWVCADCTFLNEPARPGCSMCTSPRPDDYVVKRELEETFKKSCEQAERVFLENYAREIADNYEKYLELDDRKLIPNNETFECKVCLTDIEPGEGIQLRECLHNFCLTCIKGTITNSEDIPVQCPYADDDYDCQCVLQDREIANVLSEEELQKYHNRCWAKAAGSTPNSFYCKTPDCEGWCVYEYGAQDFPCPVCGHTSCITCQAIHEGMDCKEYQDDLNLNAQNNEDARKTQEKIAEMIGEGTAMDCPGCGIVIMKTVGCDGMVCSHCRIEICWATKGRRWGPAGNGDLSGGCRCRAAPGYKMCHPECKNCH